MPDRIAADAAIIHAAAKDLRLTAEAAQETAARRMKIAMILVAIVGVAAVLVGLASGRILASNNELHDQLVTVKAQNVQVIAGQEAGKIRGFKNRAVVCRALEQNGGKFAPGDDCLSSEMRPYFTPKRSSLVP